ncbi:ComEC/Rec2 family competence protein [Pararhizobium arenae]|uniref:ComEC/Rec2 family competence protein n=1 Tax=Pararhizobium arenae TaxID=1856850 RepID=UPI00117AD019|nr:ComEC/Rec2 family competence protein [Pararhizobium arenae]
MTIEGAFGNGFLFVPLSLGFGCLVWFSGVNPGPPLNLAVLLCIFGMAAAWLRHSNTVWRHASFHAFLVLFGMLLAAYQTARMNTVVLDTSVTTTISGTVVGREVTDKGYWRYVVDVSGTAAPELRRPPERVTLLSRHRGTPVAIGHEITGKARISPPSGPALAGLNDFGFDSYFNGVGAVGYFYGKPVGGPPAEGSLPVLNSLLEGLSRLRATIGERIRSDLPGDTGAIAAALITGEERAIGRQTVEDLRGAGLAHVLAISGLNMVLAAGTLLVGARLALSMLPGVAHRFPIKKVAAAGALMMVCFYILISGGAVSAVRSWLMISLMLVAVFFDRPAISLRNVALSALVILAITPSAITSPGFQMSYAATLALIAGYRFWRDRPHEAMKTSAVPVIVFRVIIVFLAGLLLSSLIGGLSTMIYSVGHFHRIASYGLLGNMLAMPIISILVMPFGLLAMLAMPFGLERLPLLVMGQGIDWMIGIAAMVSSWDGEVTTGRTSQTGFVLVAIGGVVLCLLRTKLAILGAAMVFVGVSVILVSASPSPDMVIAEDGRLVALIDGSDVALNRERPPEFIFSQWRRALQLSDPQKPVMHPALSIPLPAREPGNHLGAATALGEVPPFDGPAAKKVGERLLSAERPGRFACVATQWCAAQSIKSWRIVVVEDARLTGTACDIADIVIVMNAIRLDSCRSGARLVTARTLRQTGTLEFYLAPKASGEPVRIVSALTPEELERPWAVHRLYDWRTGEFAKN